MSSRPGLFIATAGAAKRPLGVGKPSRSLRGAKAARIVRALCDSSRSWGVRELAQQTRTDPGYVSRIIDLLESEALIDRGARRQPIRAVNWEGLIRRWADDYSVFEANETSSYLAPRGLQAVADTLRQSKFGYAITGSYAASKRAPITVPRLLTMYADDPARLAETVGLREADQGINVLLLRPFDPVVYERTWESEGLRYAAAPQIAVDLSSGSGREPSEAEALLAWMKDNESAWRI
ncbi:MAG: hypothetical protein FJZ38_05305 [Candidatus Rokubacteria bacterium]|nr:hypothetical protein [Candidatus Rokubacteria bacterium]